MSSYAVFNPTCAGCGRRMGDMTEDELFHLVKTDGPGAKCFDCSPDEANQCPSLFLDWERGGVFVMGDKSLEVVSGADFPEFMIDVSHTHVRLGALSCLSSSTNLNNHTLSNTVTGAAIETNARCPNCGVERMFEDVTFRECPNCDYQELKPMELILPSWIVGGEQRPTGKELEAVFCSDCMETAISGNGQYCAYHHVLLNEQEEDASLGWGHE